MKKISVCLLFALSFFSLVVHPAIPYDFEQMRERRGLQMDIGRPAGHVLPHERAAERFRRPVRRNAQPVLHEQEELVWRNDRAYSRRILAWVRFLIYSRSV